MNPGMPPPAPTRPQDRMMQARQPVAPPVAPTQANPMELIAQLTPEVVDSMSEDDAKGTLMEIVTLLQGGDDTETQGEQVNEPAIPGQPPM